MIKSSDTEEGVQMNRMTVSGLLEGLVVRQGPDASVEGIAYRSDDVRAGDVFFCIPGTRFDGHDFASQAVEAGAVALVCSHDLEASVPVFVVEDVRRALAIASSRLFSHPSAHLDVIGVTGTNGKTTTTYLIEWILACAGRRTGVIGTVETRIGSEVLASARTTPESYDLQRLFARMRDAGVDGVAMEVSSHAVELHRIDGTRFAVAAFSNLTQDHLDFHGTMEEYYAAKEALFLVHDVGARVIRIDDEWGRRLYTACSAAGRSAITVSRGSFGDVRVLDERPTEAGTAFSLVWRGTATEVRLPLVGSFNVDNAALAAGCALALGIDMGTVARALSGAPQVPGRLERVEASCDPGFTVLVDYAHTPDSIEKAVAALRATTPGRILVVFGCGGDRDPGKRPLMGAAALTGDVAVVTSDNPRSEDPSSIIEQVRAGMRGEEARTLVCPDRREAIATAITAAEPGDTVLIAGKGHEDYQILGDRTVPFDDRIVAREELERICS